MTVRWLRLLFAALVVPLGACSNAPGGGTPPADEDPPVVAEWGRQFGTTQGDFAIGMAVDALGTVYAGGFTLGAIDGAALGEGDAFLRAYDAAGALLWTRQFGTAQLDTIESVAVRAGEVFDRKVIVAGSTRGNLEGARVGNSDAFVRAYDSQGDVLWTRQFGTTFGNNVVRALATDPSGGVYAVGETSGDLEGEQKGSGDAFIRRYDANGGTSWTQQFGSGTPDGAYAVATDSVGNAYVVGTTECANSGEDGPFLCGFIRKYDLTGGLVWASDIVLQAGVAPLGVAVDAMGRAYVTGSTFPGPSLYIQADAFVRAFDASGGERWTRTFGAGGEDQGQAVAIGSDGGVWITGYQDWRPDLAQAPKVFLRHYSQDGVLASSREIGTGEGRAVASSPDGTMLVAGDTTASLFATNIGLNDAFVTKVAP
jgi:hypothetical protein